MSQRPVRNEARETLEAHLFRMARGESVGQEGVRDVVNVLFSFVQDVEGRQAKLEGMVLDVAQKAEGLERQLADLPNPRDTAAIHKLVFGDDQLRLVGLLQSVRETQAVMMQVQRSLWRLQVGMGGLISFWGVMAVVAVVLYV